MSSTTTTALVVATAEQRHSQAEAGESDTSRVTYRTRLDGRATNADREGDVVAALRAAGLVGDVTPVPLPRTIGESGEVDARKYAQAFTPQRMLVLGCFYRGLSYTGTAEHLHLSVGTVKSHALNLYRIFGVHSKVEVCIEAVRCGVLPAPPAEAPRRASRARKATSA